MTITAPSAAPRPLTYEEYLAEEEIHQRYDIVDGIREFMTNPTRRHQKTLLRLAKLLDRYNETSGFGEVIIAPCDVLIRQHPLQTRQPDLLVISHAQLARCGADTDAAPLVAAPELVVEILSPTETRRVRNAKIVDYGAIGVQECWVVSPEAETIEVLRFRNTVAETVATYSNSQNLQSVCFPDLTFPVADVFPA